MLGAGTVWRRFNADDGRPAWTVRLLGVLVLRFVLRMSDRRTAEAVNTIGVGGWHCIWNPATYAIVLYWRSFAMAVKSHQEGQAETVLDYLVEQGWLRGPGGVHAWQVARR
jgi:hypothetical protein